VNGSRRGLAILVVVAATLLTFAPVVRNDFVRWDDHVNLLENPRYRGLGGPQLAWMLTTFHLGHYMPVTWLSFGLDFVVWGMDPVGYHLTSLLLHAANAALVLLVASRLLARAGEFPSAARLAGAAAAALFFAVHPLRAASVAWATERRDVLSGFFLLLAVLAYLRAADGGDRRHRWLAASVATYVLALGAKAVVMTLPVVLLLLDVYPLGRLPAHPGRWLAPETRTVLREKIPYAVVSGVGMLLAWHGRTFVAAPPEYPWGLRLAVAVHGLWFYVVKTLVPRDLSPLYEFSLEGRTLIAAVAVAGLTALAVLLGRRCPAVPAACAYYAISVSPVIGLVYVGALVADQHTYVPGLGWAFLVGAAAAMLARARLLAHPSPRLVRLGAALLVAWLVVLATLTWRQVQVWRDTESLWRHAIAAYPDCATCHGSLGSWLVVHGRLAAGLAHLEQALALAPDRVWLHINIGTTLADLGRLPEAMSHYERVLDRCDRDGTPCRGEAAAAHANIGFSLTRLGRVDEARQHFRRAVELEPGLAPRLAPGLGPPRPGGPPPA
jgi:protein O-mannosyl-transferase